MGSKKHLCLLCCVLVILIPGFLSAEPLQIKAKSAILVNANNGQILFAKDPDRRIQPASITKVLSLYLLQEALRDNKADLHDKVRISRKAGTTRGSRMYAKPGSEVPLEDLMKGMAVVSGNDASIAVAEHIGGNVEAFVDMMNEKAEELQMRHSHFQNPNGLPAKGQFTTARDIMKLALAYLHDFPESLKIHSLRSFSFEGITKRNRNDLLDRFPEVDGLKTGYVSRSGYHIVATAKRGETRLIAVVMGCRNHRARTRDAMKLLTAGFNRTGGGTAKSQIGRLKEEDAGT